MTAVSRRPFIVGVAVTSLAVVVPIAALSIAPTIKGLKWQSWPFDATPPETDYASGHYYLKEGSSETYLDLLKRFMDRHRDYPLPMFIEPIPISSKRR